MLCARRRPQARPLRTSPPTSFCTSVRTKNRTRLRQDQHGPSTLVVYAVFSSDDVSVGESENPALHRSTAEAIVKIAEDCQKSKLKSSTPTRSEEHTSELQSRLHLVCRLLLEKK